MNSAESKGRAARLGAVARAMWSRPESRAGFALVLLVLFNAMFTSNFAAVEWRDGRLFGALIDVLRNGSAVVLLAVGMTLVIAADGIDLSVGSLMAVSGTVAALLISGADHPGSSWQAIAAAAGVAAAALAGVVNGVMVGFVGLQPIVATLVMLVAARGVAQALAADQKVRFSSGLIEGMARGAWLGLPAPVWVAAVVAVAATLTVRWTWLGMAVHAVGENERAARICGVRVRGVRVLTYAVSGACAGIAGLIAAGDIGEADTANCGMYLELDAILAVVIGGTRLTGGRALIIGSVIGALIMQTLNVMLQMRGVPAEHGLVVKAVVVLGVCLARSEGVMEAWRRWRR